MVRKIRNISLSLLKTIFHPVFSLRQNKSGKAPERALDDGIIITINHTLSLWLYSVYGIA
jgi:hypothetical protein